MRPTIEPEILAALPGTPQDIADARGCDHSNVRRVLSCLHGKGLAHISSYVEINPGRLRPLWVRGTGENTARPKLEPSSKKLATQKRASIATSFSALHGAFFGGGN